MWNINENLENNLKMYWTQQPQLIAAGYIETIVRDAFGFIEGYVYHR